MRDEAGFRGARFCEDASEVEGVAKSLELWHPRNIPITVESAVFTRVVFFIDSRSTKGLSYVHSFIRMYDNIWRGVYIIVEYIFVLA